MGNYPEPVGNGGLWIRKSAKGGTYLSGVLNFTPAPGASPLRITIAAFLDGQKRSEKAPDYQVIVNTSGPDTYVRGRPGEEPTAKQAGPTGASSEEDVPF